MDANEREHIARQAKDCRCNRPECVDTQKRLSEKHQLLNQRKDEIDALQKSNHALVGELATFSHLYPQGPVGHLGSEAWEMDYLIPTATDNLAQLRQDNFRHQVNYKHLQLKYKTDMEKMRVRNERLMGAVLAAEKKLESWDISNFTEQQMRIKDQLNHGRKQVEALAQYKNCSAIIKENFELRQANREAQLTIGDYEFQLEEVSALAEARLDNLNALRAEQDSGSDNEDGRTSEDEVEYEVEDVLIHESNGPKFKAPSKLLSQRGREALARELAFEQPTAPQNKKRPANEAFSERAKRVKTCDEVSKKVRRVPDFLHKNLGPYGMSVLESLNKIPLQLGARAGIINPFYFKVAPTGILGFTKEGADAVRSAAGQGGPIFKQELKQWQDAHDCRRASISEVVSAASFECFGNEAMEQLHLELAHHGSSSDYDTISLSFKHLARVLGQVVTTSTDGVTEMKRLCNAATVDGPEEDWKPLQDKMLCTCHGLYAAYKLGTAQKDRELPAFIQTALDQQYESLQCRRATILNIFEKIIQGYQGARSEFSSPGSGKALSGRSSAVTRAFGPVALGPFRIFVPVFSCFGCL